MGRELKVAYMSSPLIRLRKMWMIKMIARFMKTNLNRHSLVLMRVENLKW